MSMDESAVSVSGQKRTFSALLAAHVVKRPRYESEQLLQEAAVELLNRHQNLSELLLEVSSSTSKVKCNAEGTREELHVGNATPKTPSTHGGSLLVHALQRQAVEMGLPVGVLSAIVVAERVVALMGHGEGRSRQILLNSTQRVQLSVLLQSTRELLSLRAFSPQLFCRELWKTQKRPMLEVVWHLHSENILALEHILENEESAGLWLVEELQALCGRTAADEDVEEGVRQEILTGVVSVLVRAGFQEPQDMGSSCRNLGRVCCSLLDTMLSWVLDNRRDQPPGGDAAGLWVRVLDPTVCAVSISGEVLRRFFTHSLTHALTYRPTFKVSDAIALQSEWCFAKTCRLWTTLYCKLSVLLGAEELLSHLQQVLETHEVNWQHVLSCLSTLLVHYPLAQRTLTELLSRILSSAFEGYDVENMITAFLLARQGALEGPAVFPSYSEWFRMAFGSASSYQGHSKKALVFLLKFLSDLVPFDPPQYLKVHMFHPPYVPVKHRALLQEYVTLAKTRLADLKLSMEDMGLSEDVSGAGPQVQASQDVEKAISLFESSGKISAAVMEASIFRRPYFLSRFLPALLSPRVLPAKADVRMAFIESLKKAEKIPPSLYSTYIQSCERERLRQQEGVGVEMLEDLEPQQKLQTELQELNRLLSAPGCEEVLAQLARISEILTGLIPDPKDDVVDQITINFHLDPPTPSELDNKVITIILRSFCQNVMDASRNNPPNRQGPWATQFVRMLLGHKRLFISLLYRLQDLLCSQGSSLGAAHVLGLAVLVVHLHESRAHCPLVLPRNIPFSEALCSDLPCSTDTEMSFCLRICVVAASYGLCRSASSPECLQQYVPSSLCRKLLHLIPRLLVDARERSGVGVKGEEDEMPGMWKKVTDPCVSWHSSVLALWGHAPFRTLRALPDYQLSFAEWVAFELGVQRSRDALSDSERQEYQQWACQDLYLPITSEAGGCAGDIGHACVQIVRAILDWDICVQTTQHRLPETDTCLPDLLSRLQELVYELELTRASGREDRDGANFLVDLISERCSMTCDLETVGSQLDFQQTLHTWSRVVVSLPATMLVAVKSREGRLSLDCRRFTEHVNHRHRNGCVPACRLPYRLTAHFFRGVLTTSLRCDHPSRAVNELLSLLCQQCPLLLVSAGCWWVRLCPVLVSLWNRLTGDPLPEELQCLADCSTWAFSTVRGETAPLPQAPPLLLAAFLHQAGKGQEKHGGIGGRLGKLGHLEQLQEHRRPLLVFLLFFYMTDFLSTLLQPQEEECSEEQAQELCMEILTHLGDTTDWLLLFYPPGAEQGMYQAVTSLTTDGNTRLMPLVFYSLLPRLDAQALGRVAKSSGFLLTALRSYCTLTKLFLDGQTPPPSPSTQRVDLLQILSQAQQMLLKAISMSPQSCFSHSQIRQLKEEFGELDPEVATALSSRMDRSCLSYSLGKGPGFS